MLIGPEFPIGVNGRRRQTVVHYRSAEITITDDFVEVRGVRLAINDLRGVVRYTRRNPRWMTIEALHRGDPVTLYSTRDETEFGRVRRALIRAIERDRDRL
jgi:hypothetical protein